MLAFQIGMISLSSVGSYITGSYNSAIHLKLQYSQWRKIYLCMIQKMYFRHLPSDEINVIPKMTFLSISFSESRKEFQM